MTEMTIDRRKPRSTLQRLIADGNIEKVLELAGMLHGHYCPGLALGVKAVEAAFSRLCITDNTGMEEIMAVAECNSCVVDGIQFAAGCTLGNNALVYKDLGKTAATFYRRGADRAVRVSIRDFAFTGGTEEERRDGDELFEKAVKRREKLTDTENARMKEIWIQRSFETAAMPVEKLFDVSDVPVPQLPFAPILDSQVCSVCSEKIMESKAVFRNGKPVCIDCAGEEYRMVLGKGIASARGVCK